MLLQVISQSFIYCLLDGSLNLAVTELGLGLSLKLWLGYLYGDYGCESFAEVLACDLYLCLLNLLCNGWVGIGVCLECTCQRSTETGEVCTALDGVDVVYVRMNVFRLVGVVHYRNLDRYVVLLCLQIDYIIEKMLAVTVYVAYEFL